MTKLSVPQQSQSQQLGLQTMNNVHLPYEIHPMQIKVSNKSQTLHYSDYMFCIEP